METVKERIEAYLYAKRITKADFCRTIDVSKAYVATLVRSISPEKLKKIADCYPDLDIAWLMTGEGSMIKPISNVYKVQETDSSYQPSNGVPFYDEEAASCGKFAGFGAALEANNPSDIIIVPGMRAQEGDFFIRTRGRSMIDTLHPEHSIPEGALVLVRQWHADYIQWGEIYCVATPEGYAIKRLMPSADPNKVTLQSADQMLYPPYEIEKTTILALGRVIAVLTYKDI